MKVLILDLDGPLANDRTSMQTGVWKSLDPVAAEILNNLCEAYGLKIAISSNRFARTDSHYRQVCKLMEEAGLDPKHLHKNWSVREKEDYVEDISNNKPRHKIIEGWLNRNLEVTHFCVVDDEAIDIANFVQVSREDGILTRHFQEIAKYLEIDLSGAFDIAQQKRGYLKRQYDLPFNLQAEANNHMIDKTFSI